MQLPESRVTIPRDKAKKIGVVKIGSSIPTFTMTPGRGGEVIDLDEQDCPDDLDNVGHVGFACRGGAGGVTDVRYRISGGEDQHVQFGGKFSLTKEEGVPGGEGAKGGKTLTPDEVMSYFWAAQQAAQEREDGTGGEGHFGDIGSTALGAGGVAGNANRIYVEIFFGNRRDASGEYEGACVYDSHVRDLTSADACTPNATYDTFNSPAEPGRGASIRIIW